MVALIGGGLVDLFGGLFAGAGAAAGAIGGGVESALVDIGLMDAAAASAAPLALPGAVASAPLDLAGAVAPTAAGAVAPAAFAPTAADAAAISAGAAGAGVGPVGGVLGDIGATLGGIGSSIGSGLSSGAAALGQGLGDIGSSVTGALTGAGAPGGAAVGGATTGAGGAAAPAAAAGASTGDIVGGAGIDAIAPGGFAPPAAGPLQLPGATLGASAPASLTGTAAATTGAGAAAPAASSAGLTGFGPVDSTLSFLGKNPSMLLGGAGLAKSLMAKNNPVAGQNALELQALQQQVQGTQLQSYLSTGTLPPGVQASLDQAHAASAATIKSQYAARGQSGSSAEAQDLNNLAQNISGQGAQIATQLLQTGIQESNMSSAIYEKLMQAQIQQDSNLSGAIANFAGALAGSGAKALTT